MTLGQRLVVKATQSLKLTPQLRQAIKILELSTIELGAYLDQELEQNPLIERVERRERNDAANERDANEREDPRERAYDEDEPAFPMEPATADAGPENRVAAPVSLYDHLVGQLNLDVEDNGDKVIGMFLIDRLDEAGYLDCDLADVAALFGCAEERVAGVLAKLQRFDPPGLFARTLAECLALQLAELDRLDPAMQCLLDNLDLVARGEMERLCRLCGVDEEDVRDMVAEVRRLDPKPALAFESFVTSPLVPDLLARREPDGRWEAHLNPDALPRLSINSDYRLPSATADPSVRKYLGERGQAARWLIRALEQRADTLLKVGREIMRSQQGFFTRGVEGLTPMTLKMVADALEIHESTVSRAIRDKFIATPKGTVALRYFFSAALSASSGGDDLAAEAVKAKIKAAVDAENPDRPLSDDALVKALRGQGVDVARRTVAKYREALGIASSFQRKRAKALRAL